MTPWTAARQASPSFTVSWSLLKLMSTESVMPSNHFILCRPLLLLSSSFPASGSFPMSRLFASDSQSIGASASVLPLNIRLDYPPDSLIPSPSFMGSMVQNPGAVSSPQSASRAGCVARVLCVPCEPPRDTVRLRRAREGESENFLGTSPA